jgi:predicted ATP-dependent endonuclease of OLD family
MRIAYVEISNFRKLLSVRIDLAEKTTLLVGANNSGKTSAMLALRYFLVSSGSSMFSLNDFTLSHWPKINTIGANWLSTKGDADAAGLQASNWAKIAPTLDLWLQVADGEIHHVSKLIPTLDWAGGLIGVRLRYEPKDVEALRKDYLNALESVAALKAAALAKDADKELLVQLWPENLTAFLERRLRLQTHFTIRAYTLNPALIKEPEDGQARPQEVSADQEPIEIENLKGLIRIDEINAQRVFGGETETGDGVKQDSGSGRQLSAQLRTYYTKHLDPFENPDPSDLDALEAIEAAQKVFDQRLAGGFKPALDEVQGIGYPGVTDPKITISTRLNPVEGLNHESSVQYEVDVVTADGTIPILRLPEDRNGLGYQNLISMIFRLMSFRDAWMRVGKAGKGTLLDNAIQPMHIVLVEEPEAHLHAQVQQVFIKKAYSILRAHQDLGDKTTLHTQLIVSTHSNHVAHETDFSCLRYFRRLPAGLKATVPVSTVVNLSLVFGKENDTKRFVTRYLKAQHSDLFFADAAILVEGPSERMFVPHFIRRKYPFLNQCYITMLEIGGSHAHRLQPLIDELKLLTVVITDLDAGNHTGGKAEQPERGKNQITNNVTLGKWVPKRSKIDDLLDLKEDEKVCSDDGSLFAVRAAYQIPVMVNRDGEAKSEVLSNTFEDALVFENLAFFSKLEGTGLVRKVKDAIKDSANVAAIGKAMFDELKTAKKAEFALDVIDAPDFELLNIPTYISQGLDWLQERLKKKPTDLPIKQTGGKKQ